MPRVRESVPQDLSPFDLVFIDDSQHVGERSETIAAVASRRPRGLVLIHDFEQRQYGRVARDGFDNVRRVKTFTPQVGVAWNDDANVDVSALERSLAVVEANKHIDPLDLDAWADLLRVSGTAG